MGAFDDDLTELVAHGAKPLPAPTARGHVERDGARIWYATFGTGRSVILLCGGPDHSGNWGCQVPTLMTAGYRPIVIDSRERGRSTRDAQPYAYARIASDVRVVMNILCIDCTPFIGWSNGVCIVLTLAMQTSEHTIDVFFFGCSMDPSGAKPFEPTSAIGRCSTRHRKDYTVLLFTPNDFDAFVVTITEMMQTQPGTTTVGLAATHVPVAITYSEHDEFIRPERIHYLTRTIPDTRSVLLPGVSHFASLQKSALFNDAAPAFLHRPPPLQAVPGPTHYPQE